MPNCILYENNLYFEIRKNKFETICIIKKRVYDEQTKFDFTF